jgi:branched-chain amino acid transport system substrate-binding protein
MSSWSTTPTPDRRSGKALMGAIAVKDDVSDIDAAVAQLDRLRPKAVVFSSSTRVAAEVMKRFKPRAGSTQFYAYSFVDGRAVAAQLGALATGLVVSQVVPDPWNGASRLAQQYRAAMTSFGAPDYSYQSFEGYIAARVLTEALRRAGPAPTPARVRSALSSSGAFAFGDFRAEFSERRNIGRQQVELTMVSRDGRYVK